MSQCWYVGRYGPHAMALNLKTAIYPPFFVIFFKRWHLLRQEVYLFYGLYKEGYSQIFKWVSFWLHSFCGKWEVLDSANRFNHTSWVVVVTSADRPQSVRNRCIIEVFWWRYYVVTLLLLCFSVDVKGFCHRTESDIFLFLISYYYLLIKLHNITIIYSQFILFYWQQLFYFM